MSDARSMGWGTQKKREEHYYIAILDRLVHHARWRNPILKRNARTRVPDTGIWHGMLMASLTTTPQACTSEVRA